MFQFEVHSQDGQLDQVEFPAGYSPTAVEAHVFGLMACGCEVVAMSPLMMLVFEDDVILEDVDLAASFDIGLAFAYEPGFMGTVHIPVGNPVPTLARARAYLA